jgi:cytochrome c-type biogenesis protein CcmE
MTSHRTRNRWIAVAAVVVAALGFFVITMGGIGENLVYYWGPTDIEKAGDKAIGATIRLGGQVAPNSIKTASATSNLEFDVTDGTAVVHVKSSGVPPQMFREGIGVVVEGTMTKNGWFESQRLMVSHGNEYKAPTEGGPKDVKELMKTTEGLPDEKSGS